MNKLPRYLLHRVLTLLCFAALMAGLTLSARAESVQPVPPPPLGAWTVTQAASPSNVGLRMFFSPDGVFLMVDPRAGIGVAGSYTIGRTGLLVYVYGYGRSAEFINGTYTQEGDVLRIDVKRSGFMEPQQVVLQRMKLQ
jgi:hypothetical protein